MNYLTYRFTARAACLSILLCASSLLGHGRAASQETEDSFLDMVRQYADTMLEKGRGRWGNTDSPLFASMMDRHTHDLVGFEYEVLEEEEHPWGKLPQRALITGAQSEFGAGLRQHERMYDASNPAHDQELYSLLYRLGEVTGDPQYPDAADAALSYFLRNCQDERTGFLAWGEHLGWHLPTDSFMSLPPKGRVHELWQADWPHYERGFAFGEAEAEALRRFARSQIEYQIRDLEKGLFNRHAYMDGEVVHRAGAEFPRFIGQMVEIWALAWENSEDPEFRDQMIYAIETLLAATEKRRLESGAIPFGTGGAMAEMYFMPHDLVMVCALHRAAERLPEPVAEQVREFAGRTDDLILNRLPRNPDAPGILVYGYVEDLRPGDPRNPDGDLDPYTTHWDAWVLRTNVGTARLMLQRYRQTGLQGYREEALALADTYLEGEIPGRNEKLQARRGGGSCISPAMIAGAIDLMLESYELTDDERYLERAIVFGEAARELFFDERSPLPMVTAEDRFASLYESITGGPDLMFALLKLHLATHPDSIGKRDE